MKPTISQAVLKKIISQYDIGELINSRIFQKGQAHTNLFLKTNKGKFILKKYNNRSKEQILSELDILNHLNKAKYPCIKPLINKYKRKYVLMNGQYCILYLFIEGKNIEKPTSHHRKLAARALARLHKVSMGFKPKYHKFKPAITKSSCLNSARENAKQLKNKNEAKQRLDSFKNKLKAIKILDTLPKGVIHGDFSQENLLFSNRKLTAVLDFDGASHGSVIFDLASLIYFWAWFKEPKRKINLKNAKFLIKEYEKVRKISLQEKNHMYDALLLKTLVYLSWNIPEIKIDKETKINDYEFFKQIVEQVENIEKDKFFRSLFGK